jgi:hypothetical protein
LCIQYHNDSDNRAYKYNTIVIVIKDQRCRNGKTPIWVAIWYLRGHGWAEVPCSDIDRSFFRISTQVTVGDGRPAKFWESSWVNGQAPRDLSPQLYKLAWRKNQSVRDDLQNWNWTRVLWKMSSASEMAEFISLWTLVTDFNLTEEEDCIRWK